MNFSFFKTSTWKRMEIKRYKNKNKTKNFSKRENIGTGDNSKCCKRLLMPYGDSSRHHTINIWQHVQCCIYLPPYTTMLTPASLLAENLMLACLPA